MAKPKRSLYAALITVLETYSAALILVMLALVLVGVFYRYVVDASLSWYDEFAGYLLVWITMYGSVVALARGKHISFETVVEKFSPPWQRVADVFSTLCVLAFSIVVLVSGWQLVREMGGETSVSVPDLRMAWVYSVMPISGALMALICVVRLIAVVTGRDAAVGRRGKAMEEAQ